MVNWHSRRGIDWASGALGRTVERIVSVAAGSADARRLYEQESVQGADQFQMHDLILLVHLGEIHGYSSYLFIWQFHSFIVISNN